MAYRLLLRREGISAQVVDVMRNDKMGHPVVGICAVEILQTELAQMDYCIAQGLDNAVEFQFVGVGAVVRHGVVPGVDDFGSLPFEVDESFSQGIQPLFGGVSPFEDDLGKLNVNDVVAFGAMPKGLDVALRIARVLPLYLFIQGADIQVLCLNSLAEIDKEYVHGPVVEEMTLDKSNKILE